MREVTIAGRKLGDGHPPFVVAEVGLNHNGDIDIALDMIAAAKKAECDAVKFATFRADEFCSPSDPLYQAFKDAEMPDWAWRRFRDECDQRDIIFFSTPQNESDLKLLLDVGVSCIKIGSDDLTNTDLIAAYAKHGLPLILSTGMADAADIRRAVSVVSVDHPLVICACTSEYPCPPEHANVGRVMALKNTYRNSVIGYSDHTVGAMAAATASVLGASYFEKHFTLDHDAKGPDHKFSADPTQLATWAWSIRHVRTLIGDGVIGPTAQEKINRIHWRRESGQKIRRAA